MSRRHANQKQETLLLFEILVENIQIDGEKKISDVLAVGIRLLDFPTLLVNPPEFGGGNDIRYRQQDNNNRWVYSFNRGKSCFFEMNLDSLHTQLISTPLYVMILDVKEEIPKLIGTSLISLATIVNRIKHDSTEHDVTGCSSYGERGVVCVNNLAEEPVGVISLSYKLLIVGGGLPPHVTQKIPVYREQCPQVDIMKKNAREKLHSGSMIHPFFAQDDYGGGDIVDKQAESTQTGHNPMSQIHNTVEAHNSFEEDLAVFCPPRLYYCNSGKEKHKTQGSEYRLIKPDSSVVTYEESFSKIEHFSATDQASKSTPKKTASVATNVTEEALRPLPLLNALFVELSQLNVQNLHQLTVSSHRDSLSVCKHSSTEALDGQGSTPKTSKSMPEQERRRGYGSYLKHSHYPRNVSPKNMKADPGVPLQNNQAKALVESKAHGKKLVYGTTKSYNLRCKKNNNMMKQQDCMVSHTSADETGPSVSKGKKTVKQNSLIPKENAKNTENMEMFSVVEDTTKHDDRSECESPKQDETLLGLIPIINDDDDASSRKLPKMSMTWTKSESHNVKLNSCRNSRDSSHESSQSESHNSGSEKGDDYDDDFNSFDASDTDNLSSPEPAQETPQFLHRFHASDLDSEPVEERPRIPSPIRGQSPVQRILRGTHLIQPQTQGAALSFSSNEDDKDVPAFLQMMSSKEQQNNDNSAATASRGQKSASSSLVWEGSLNSLSSSPLEAEELEDDLGSLDFKKEYQHISELVGFKLPGYTM
nr:microtubule-associated protein 10-like [Nerophis lumbriciformis]